MQIEQARLRIAELETEVATLKAQKQVLSAFASAVSDSVNPVNLSAKNPMQVLGELQMAAISALAKSAHLKYNV